MSIEMPQSVRASIWGAEQTAWHEAPERAVDLRDGIALGDVPQRELLVHYKAREPSVNANGFAAMGGTLRRAPSINYKVAIGPAIDHMLCQRLPLQQLRTMYTGQDILPADGTQTLMLRNVPQTYTPEDMLAELTSFLPQASFNYLHVPQDLRRGRSISFAFVNFVNGDLVQRAFFALSGRQWRLAPEAKPCQVSTAKAQGIAANMECYASNDREGRSSPLFVRYENGIQRVWVWDGCSAVDLGSELKGHRRLPPPATSARQRGEAGGHVSVSSSVSQWGLEATPPPHVEVRGAQEPPQHRFTRVSMWEVFED